jgi:hypothetical protein
MGRGFLDSLRGGDGRSLARALILLLFLSLFGSGLAAGAAAGGSLALCSADQAGDALPLNADRHAPDCCVAGTAPLGWGLQAGLPPIAGPRPAVLGVALPEAVSLRPSAWRAGNRARGPPLEA